MTTSTNHSFDPYTTYPDFYHHPIISDMGKNPRWSISDKDKMPIDMSYISDDKKLLLPAFYTRIPGAKPLDKPTSTVDLHTLHTRIPDAANVAYYLDGEKDKYAVLDIEKTCPNDLRKKLCSIPHYYAEASLSGKGIHLLIDKPVLTNNNRVALTKPAIKNPHGFYEILLNHWVTFTRNIIVFPTTMFVGHTPHSTYVSYDNNDKLQSLYESLESTVTFTKKADAPVFDDLYTFLHSYDNTDIGAFIEPIIAYAQTCVYEKTPSDFNDDMSKWEFGCTAYYLNTIINHAKEKYHIFFGDATDIVTIILYRTIVDIIPHRDKHDEERSGVPWLMYITSSVIENNFDN